jgi:hypothetical protein
MLLSYMGRPFRKWRATGGMWCVMVGLAERYHTLYGALILFMNHVLCIMHY